MQCDDLPPPQKIFFLDWKKASMGPPSHSSPPPPPSFPGNEPILLLLEGREVEGWMGEGEGEGGQPEQKGLTTKVEKSTMY